MSRLHDVADALLTDLKEYVPEIPWVEQVEGVAFPKKLTGTAACSKLDFAQTAKGLTTCSAQYTLTILSPDPAKNSSPRYIEDLAVKTYGALMGTDLGGIADNVSIKSIYFGAAPGRPEYGVALIELIIDFEMED